MNRLSSQTLTHTSRRVMYAGPGLMCFSSATLGQKAFRGKGCKKDAPFNSEAKTPEWQRNQGLLELGRGARSEMESEDDLDDDLHREAGGQI